MPENPLAFKPDVPPPANDAPEYPPHRNWNYRMGQMNKAEWMAVIALFLNVGTIAFAAGELYSTQQDHERRLVNEETKSDAIIPKVERIDANVAFLTELARETRAKGDE